nr:hypothetical protein [uncultured Gellertiella sp.]
MRVQFLLIAMLTSCLVWVVAIRSAVGLVDHYRLGTVRYEHVGIPVLRRIL